MTFLFIACLVLLALIGSGFTYYAKTTNDIIKAQEREISRLKLEKEYLERNRVKIEQITIDTDPDNLPSFEPW